MKILESSGLDPIKKFNPMQSKKITLQPGESTRIQNHHDSEFLIIHSGAATLYTQKNV
jgi:mannose-6-phosphate isomerase-like protein (cupin superfamily)